MKTFTIPQLKKIAAEAGYTVAALENDQGARLQSFNQMKTGINKQLDLFPTRLKSEMNPDGVYYVLMAQSTVKSKDPFKFPIVKGKVSAEELSEVEKKKLPLTHAVIVPPEERVLSWQGALEMQQEISNLKNEVARLKLELNNAQELLDQYEEEDDLKEGQESNPVLKTIESLGPTLSALADKYFGLEEKKLDLEKLRIQHHIRRPQQGQKQQQQSQQPKQRPEVQIGSKEHMALIETLFENEDDESLNLELDKLQAVYPALHDEVVKRLEQESAQEEGDENNGQ